MKLRNGIAVAFAALALVVAGCGDDETSCPTETPQVSALASGCVERAGEPVSFPVRLCPTCNQIGARCDVDLSAVGTGQIFLDPKVESCESASTCPPACDLNTISCSFTAPAAPGTYTVIAFDPATNQTRQADLLVIPSGAESCAL